MVATPARIGFSMEEWRRGRAVTQQARDRYGDLARETEDPLETFFDDVDDATAAAVERQSLLGTERRRFRVTVKGVAEVMALQKAGIVPLSRYIDPDRDVDRPMLITETTYDFAKDEATLTLWG